MTMAIYHGENLLAGNVNTIPVDNALSTTSENPVENNVITAALTEVNEKLDTKIDVDDIASATNLGIVKIGDGLSSTSDGTISTKLHVPYQIKSKVHQEVTGEIAPYYRATSSGLNAVTLLFISAQMNQQVTTTNRKWCIIEWIAPLKQYKDYEPIFALLLGDEDFYDTLTFSKDDNDYLVIESSGVWNSFCEIIAG